MNQIELLVSPSELADIKGIRIDTVFSMIRNKELSYILTDEGIRISIIYQFDQ